MKGCSDLGKNIIMMVVRGYDRWGYTQLPHCHRNKFVAVLSTL